MLSLLRNLQFAFRTMRKNPGFTLAAVLTLAVVRKAPFFVLESRKEPGVYGRAGSRGARREFFGFQTTLMVWRQSIPIQRSDHSSQEAEKCPETAKKQPS